MNTLYLDCSMGAAGDMLMAALYELLPDREAFLQQMNTLQLPGLQVAAKPTVKCGIAGTHMLVAIHGVEEEDHHHDHNHDHSDLPSILKQIQQTPLPEAVKQQACAVYETLAAAEAKAHGCPVSHIHFHEVGTLDAIADILGVCLAMHMLEIGRVTVSPVCIGFGEVHCAHGTLPVPAPATANLLEGIPCYAGDIRGELCTPTGAALLRHFADAYGPMPAMIVQSTGYGMGKKDFSRANCVRAILGKNATDSETCGPNERIVELCCNLDDMTGEEIGYAIEQLWQAGALDVFTIPIQMKKQRPAVLLSCLVYPQDADHMAAEMLRHTSTFGVRRYDAARYALQRTFTEQRTVWGSVTVKHGEGYGTAKTKTEYESLTELAKSSDKPLAEVRNSLKQA